MKRLLLFPFILLISFINAQEYWMQDGSVTTCSGMFYDSGGPNGLFSNNENYTFTICPDRESNPEYATVLTFVGNLLMEPMEGFDYITIYDGDDTTAPVIGTWQGGQQPGGPEGVQASDIGVNPSGCLTVVFISDPAGPGPGWTAEISCQVPCQTIDVNVTTIPALDENNTVNITEGETIEFFGNATFSQSDAGATYLWDFGNGITSTELNPTYTFNEAGTYTATFTVTDGSGNPNCSEVFTFLIVVNYDDNIPCPSVEGIDPINVSPDLVVTCDYPIDENGCFVLYADYVKVRETTSYIVQSIPFEPPFPVDQGSDVTITEDDYYSPIVNFPQGNPLINVPAYRFCFFGEEKDALVVGANGRINFDTSYANDWDEYSFNQTIPTNMGHMMNTINGAYHDIDITSSYTTSNSNFTFGFEGTYPCRMFVVNYNEIPLYGSSCGYLEPTTQQIVLWEGSNYIDVYIHNKSECDGWNDGNSLIGIQGPTRNQYVVAPGRNTSSWGAQEEAWRFIPNGPELPVTIEWFDSEGNLVGTGQELNICPTEDTYYKVQVTYELCGTDDVVVSDIIDVTFDNFTVVLDDIADEKCDINGEGEVEWDLSAISYNTIASNSEDLFIEGFYTNYVSAEEGTPEDLIETPDTFLSSSATVYARVINRSNNCISILTIDLNMIEELELDSLTEPICMPPNETEYTVNLNDYNDHFLNGSFHDIFFYLNENDAIAGEANYLVGDEITNFTISETTSVYVKVETEGGCMDIAPLTIEILIPEFDYSFDETVDFCDSPELGEEIVDLTGYEDIISNGNPNATFYYFLSENDVNDFTLALDDPSQFNLTLDISDIYIQVIDLNGCYNIVTMPVSLDEAEQTMVNQNIPALEGCDEGFGTATFDLTSLANVVTNETVDHWISYHHSLEEAQDDTNPIDPDNAELSDGMLYVRVHALGKCPSITEMEVVINPAPTAEIFAPTHTTCTTDSLQLSIVDYNPQLTYEWLAESGTSLGDGETVEVSGENGDQTILLSVTNPATSCSYETSFEIDAVEVPMITSLETTNNSISATVSGQGPFEYSLDGVNWQENNTFENLPAGMYNVFVRSVNGECEGLGMSTLVLNLSNVITPNNDGFNDYFKIPFMDAFRDENGNVQTSQFFVYDRYGRLLFQDESSNEKTEFIWTGKSNGRMVESGDYWYQLILADGRKAHGHITVKNK